MVRDRRGTGRGSGAGETLGIQGIVSERKALSVQAERPGRQIVLMVRRRSTVRFRKGGSKSQVKGVIVDHAWRRGTDRGTACGSVDSAQWSRTVTANSGMGAR